MRFWQTPLLALCLITLSCETNPVRPIRADRITGSWAETFLWWRIPFPGDSGLTKTSTLTFSEDSFSLSILPSHRVLTSVNDSVFVSDWPDTSFSGKYYFSGDTLSLETDADSQRFFYKLNVDTLSLSVSIIADSPGPVPVPLGTFLWGYSDTKIAGKFIKANK